MNAPALRCDSRWPHRLAVLLCCATFPLIWVGGLVTTYDAGMAVPDWPSTYGYNLFVYPWTTWVYGPWDLFIEHGHRLLGALVGLLTIGLLAAIWRTDARRWLRGLALAALGLVVFQGGLGGARVLWDDRQLAMAHACVGPAFFALCVGLAVCTSSLWKRAEFSVDHPRGDRSGAARLKRLALFTAGLAYLQLILGAQLRHIPVTAAPALFQIFVWFHLLVALILCVHVLWLALVGLVGYRHLPALRTPLLLLPALLLVQLLLGSATWIVKYGWPHWFAEFSFAAQHTIAADSFWQAMVVTGHMAVGSLILAISVMVTLRTFRLARTEAAALGTGALMVGVVT